MTTSVTMIYLIIKEKGQVFKGSLELEGGKEMETTFIIVFILKTGSSNASNRYGSDGGRRDSSASDLSSIPSISHVSDSQPEDLILMVSDGSPSSSGKNRQQEIQSSMNLVRKNHTSVKERRKENQPSSSSKEVEEENWGLGTTWSGSSALGRGRKGKKVSKNGRAGIKSRSGRVVFPKQKEVIW